MQRRRTPILYGRYLTNILVQVLKLLDTSRAMILCVHLTCAKTDALTSLQFNRAIRMKARVMGYSLNQRGLFAGVVRDTHSRVKTNPGCRHFVY
jgi:hypothetical protein